MKVSFEVGPRNEDYIELARKALNNGGNCDILKQYLCQFMTYSQMADDGKNITQFTITASNVNADKLVDRNYVKQAYILMMTKPGDMVYGQFKVMTGFGVMMDVFGLIDTTPEGEFDAEAFVNEILDVICDGKAHSEAGWTITAKVDEANDTLTITGTRQ